MKVAPPQIPKQLDSIEDFAQAIVRDETISCVEILDIDSTSMTMLAVSLNEIRAQRLSVAQATLERSSFSDCLFKKCDFTAAKMAEASWHRVAILGSRSSGVQLQNATLRDVTFDNSKLNLANFRSAKIKNVLFKDCDLSEADFYGAQLSNVSFENCIMTKTEFSNAKLSNVDLRTSEIFAIRGVVSLGGATIDSAQLMSLAPVLAAQHNIIIAQD